MAVVDSAEAGRRAGSRATILQLRGPSLSGRALEQEATDLIATSSIPVIVSARCDVALATGAAGVNLPERDIPAASARALLGDRLVGRSVHSLTGAVRAERDGADFVIFGPIWATASHRAGAMAGLASLAEVASRLRIPVIAIGGVTEARIAECLAAGAAGYAGISLFR
jgi:thiamine-phosphate pyrophosphorylase